MTLYRRQWSRPSPRVQFSCSVMSDSLQLHGLQCARPPWPSLTPGVHSNSCPLSWWCHRTISSSSLLLPPSIFPSIRVFSNELVFQIRWPKYWSFSFSISPSNEYLGKISFRRDWFDLLAVQWTQESSPTPQFKNINFLALRFLYSPTLTSIDDYCLALTRQTFVGKVMFLLFNIQSKIKGSKELSFKTKQLTCVICKTRALGYESKRKWP